MLNKLKKILQWFVSVCFILSGLIYVGEYTVPAIVLMVLAGVIVLPPVTKKIPAFKFRKAILIITSMVLLSAGMITGENNLSPEVQAKRAAAAEAAASSKAVMEAHSTPICTTLLSQIKPCMMPWMNLRDILLLTVTRLHVAVILAR